MGEGCQNGPITLTVNTYGEYREAVDLVRSRYSDKRLVYRGQTTDKLPSPSAERTPPPRILTHLWDMFVATYLVQLSVALPESRKFYSAAGMALMQHYGHKSWFVDVSHSWDVALWFALNQFEAGKMIYTDAHDSVSPFEPLDHAFAVIPTAHYRKVKTEPGFVYIWAVNRSDDDTLVDLTSLFAKEIVRVERQQAAALYPPESGDTLDFLLVAKLQVSAKIHLPSAMNAWYLFPPPQEDLTYRAFLQIPHVVLLSSKFQTGSLARAPLNVPLYMYHLGKVRKETRALFKIILGEVAPHIWHEDQSTVANVGGNTVPIGNTVSIDLPISAHTVTGKLFMRQDDKEAMLNSGLAMAILWGAEFVEGRIPDLSDLHVWPSNNIILLDQWSHPRNLFGHREEYQRGYWVTWSGNQIYIAQIVQERDEVYYLAGAHYEYVGEGQYRLLRLGKDCAEDDDHVHATHLVRFINYTLYLLRNEAELYVIDDERHFAYYWTPSPWLEDFPRIGQKWSPRAHA